MPGFGREFEGDAGMKNSLGKIRQVEVREIFKDEARDFTPWLAKEENLALLSDEIGVQVKLLGVEANVGRFNVDILAEEEGTGRKIIIENQFNYTDHDHLGKLITYASGHDAKVIIWVFENIRDEHRQAIEWLNEMTNEDLDFFAINIQIWKIDDSNPAPKFEVIVSPNEWTKTIRSQAAGAPSETKLQQLDFWSRFKSHAATHFAGLKLQKPQPQHWCNIALGSSEAHIALTVNTRDNTLGCEVYITNNKGLFYHLKERGTEIETALKVKLEWIEATKACRIKTTKANSSILDAKQADENFEWLGRMAVTFQKQFAGLIKAYAETE
jgi:hypothetical protein